MYGMPRNYYMADGRRIMIHEDRKGEHVTLFDAKGDAVGPAIAADKSLAFEVYGRMNGYNDGRKYWDFLWDVVAEKLREGGTDGNA